MKPLSERATSAALWGGIEILLRQGIGLVLSVILARLIQPEDFGAIAMLSIFTAVATIFVDAGFGSALIQRKSVTLDETSSVFFFNVASALVAALLLVAVAPYIADFYRLPILRPLTCLMALNLFLGSFRSIHTVLLTRELNFRTQTHVALAATVVSGAVGIALAWLGWGVWALAVQIVTSTVLSVVLFWTLSPWRPALRFRLAALRSLSRYGSFMALSGLLDTVYTRLNTLLIGRLFSARDLGLYSRADHIQQIPTSAISGLLGRVAFPVFSAAAADLAALRQAARKALTAIMLINVPLMLGIFVTARPLVHVVYGEKWLPCVPFLQILSLSGILWPLHVINLNLVKSRGRSDLFFRLEVIKKSLGVTCLLIAAQISLIAMAWSQLIVAIACYFINAWHSRRLADYPINDQLRDASPYLAVGAVMVAAASLPRLFPAISPALLLVTQTLLGAAVYISLCHLLRLAALKDGALRLRRMLARRGAAVAHA